MRTSITLLGVFGVICLGMYFFQESLLFFPRGDHPETVQQLHERHDMEHITIITADYATLDGWIKKSDTPDTILYFDGNAGNITDFLAEDYLDHVNIIALNYR